MSRRALGTAAIACCLALVQWSCGGDPAVGQLDGTAQELTTQDAAANDCNDGDPCTLDYAAVNGCLHSADPCVDGSVCTLDGCTPGQGCLYEPGLCDDGDLCTVDACDANLGCVTTPKDCEDDNPCTLGACDLGVCSQQPRHEGDLCSLTNARCNAGVCAAPACVAQQSGSFLSFLDPQLDLVGRAVWQTATGFLLVGSQLASAQNPGGQSSGLAWPTAAAWLNSEGSVQLVKTYPFGFVAAVPTKDQGFAILGDPPVPGQKTGDSGSRRVVQVDAKGAVQWQVNPLGVAYGVLSQIAARPTGGVVVAGRLGQGATGLVALDSKGAILWSNLGSGGALALQSWPQLFVTASGAVIYTAWAKVDGKLRPWIAKLSAGGMPVWKRPWGLPGGPRFVGESGGELVLLDRKWSGHSVVRLDSGGAVVSKTSLPGLSTWVWPEAAISPDGGLLLAARQRDLAAIPQHGPQRHWVLRLGRRGAKGGWQWQRRHAWTHPVYMARAVVALGDRTLLTGQVQLSKTQFRTFVLLTDPFGYASCAQAGLCNQLKTCEDGKPCTLDSCDAAKGCVSLPLAVTACTGG